MCQLPIHLCTCSKYIQFAGEFYDVQFCPAIGLLCGHLACTVSGFVITSIF